MSAVTPCQVFSVNAAAAEKDVITTAIRKDLEKESREGHPFSGALSLNFFYEIAYFKLMLCFLHVSIISSGHIEDCTSPTWAARKKNIHKRDCPIPPPIERGMVPSNRAL